MLPELDSRRQPEFAMEHSMGRQGGARRRRQLCARCASLGECARPASRRPPAASSSSSAPLPLVALLRSEAWKGSDAPLPGAPLPGWGSSRERAREYGKRGYMRERTDEGERGRESVTLEPPEPCLQRVMRVRVRACARVCSGGGGGGPWRTPTSNGPARREEDPERGRDS